MGIKGQIREYSETREQRKYKENKEYWENIQDRVNWENKKYSELTWFRDIENLKKNNNYWEGKRIFEKYLNWVG